MLIIFVQVPLLLQVPIGGSVEALLRLCAEALSDLFAQLPVCPVVRMRGKHVQAHSALIKSHLQFVRLLPE